MYYITYHGMNSQEDFIASFREENRARSYICGLRTVVSIRGWSYNKFKFHNKFPKGSYNSEKMKSEDDIYAILKKHMGIKI